MPWCLRLDEYILGLSSTLTPLIPTGASHLALPTPSSPPILTPALNQLPFASPTPFEISSDEAMDVDSGTPTRLPDGRRSAGVDSQGGGVQAGRQRSLTVEEFLQSGILKDGFASRASSKMMVGKGVQKRGRLKTS